MRTKLSLSLLLLIALAVPQPAHADGGPTPGPSFGDLGVTGPPGTPGAKFRYVAGYGGTRANVLAKVATAGGRVATWRFFDEPWGPPLVTLNGDTGGLSVDGTTLVLTTFDYQPRVADTQFLVLDTDRLRIDQHLKLDGYYGYDALSPDGRLLYLVEYADPFKDPLDYRVRAYDLARGRFQPGEIVDPEEPDEQMAGQPADRLMSDDGRWAYTLYTGGEETFIHALDTVKATAVCIDLHGLEGVDFYKLSMTVPPGGGPIRVFNGDRVVALVDQDTFEVTEPGTESAQGSTVGDDDTALWLIVAAGASLVAFAGFGLWRRRPGEPAELDTAELERLVEDPEPTAEAREREPAP